MTSAPGPSTRRKLLFSLVTLVLVLAGMEAGARLTEPWWSAPPRTISLPAPRPEGSPENEDAVARAWKDAGEDPPRCVPLPMWRDEERGWTLPPEVEVETPQGYFHGNALGLRGPEITARAPGEVRLLTLGDSSVFGDCVADAEVFSSVAARELEDCWERTVTPVIGAAPGHDSSQSLRTLREVGPEVEPDWVVVGNLWSDVFRRDRLSWLEQGTAGEGEELALARRFATWQLFRRLLAPWLRSLRVGYITRDDEVGDAAHPPRVALARYAENLRHMAQLARELGARPVFLVLPAPMDLDAAPPPESVAEYREAMRQVARDENAPLVDGPSAFEDCGADLLWFFDRVHPTARGHACLGRALAHRLCSVPPRRGEPGIPPGGDGRGESG